MSGGSSVCAGVSAAEVRVRGKVNHSSSGSEIRFVTEGKHLSVSVTRLRRL